MSAKTKDHYKVGPNRSAVILGAIACTTIFSLSIGLSYPLLSFILEDLGYAETAIGINAAMTPLGVLIASPFFPRLVQHFGAWQLSLLCLAVVSMVIVSMGLTKSFAAIQAPLTLLASRGTLIL